MSTTSALLAFAAEFVLFLAAVAGVGVVVRAQLLTRERQGQTLLALGFTSLGLASFLHGSLLEPDAASAFVVVPRLAGLALVLAGSLRASDIAPRRQLWLGLGLLALAEAITISSPFTQPGSLADAARALGALGLGAALFTLSQRSISARVAASATGTILLVVLAVSVALSAVVVANVEDEAMRRIGATAQAEAAAMERAAADAVVSAKLAALVFSSSRQNEDIARLLTLAEDPDSARGAIAANELGSQLGTIAENLVFQGDILAYVNADGVVVRGVGVDRPSLRVDISSARVVRETLADQQGDRGAPAVLAGEALAAAASPVTVTARGQSIFVGVIFAAERFDASYLIQRKDADPNLSLALVGRDGLLARAGPPPPRATLVAAANEVLDGAEPTNRAVDELFVSAHPVSAAGEPVFAVVVSAPTTLVAQTRQSLFRTLFLVALGAALVALVLAAVVGERIGAGLRRLTTTAEEIRAGRLDARAQLDHGDELGALGDAFDSMAVALGSMTGELREAAVDEARLRSRLEAVVAGMGEALMAVDANGIVTDFNAAAEELFDLPAAEVCGGSVSVLSLWGGQGDDLTARVAQPRLEPWSTTGMVQRGDGAKVPVAVSCGAVRGPAGEIVGAVVVLRDLRPEREIERMKTEFLANISHEWKTPLTPIKAYAAMLSSRTFPEERTREFASEILLGAGQLERVITRLVNFATVAAGRLELRTEAVPVDDLLQAAQERWRDRIGDRHTLVRDATVSSCDVQGDRRYLDQMIDELIDNAVKYSPAGGEVVLSAGPGASTGNGSSPSVELSVSDGGVGILPERLDTIFGEFSQGDGSATRQFGGLGLGLALVRHISEAHGGALVCRSQPGVGSTFTLVLPAARRGVVARNGRSRVTR
ncbi:MAG: PAS domain-containing protein [Actinobacteria bacterium]|nr:PAS domain-containing protein [Actinomycetota bacterium]